MLTDLCCAARASPCPLFLSQALPYANLTGWLPCALPCCTLSQPHRRQCPSHSVVKVGQTGLEPVFHSLKGWCSTIRLLAYDGAGLGLRCRETSELAHSPAACAKQNALTGTDGQGAMLPIVRAAPVAVAAPGRPHGMCGGSGKGQK